MSDLVERYKHLSDYDLIVLLNHKKDYTAQAIHTAEIELKSRSLSEEQISKLNAEYFTSLSNARIQKIKKSETKINFIDSIIDKFNPWKKNIDVNDKFIRLTVLFFIMFSLAFIYLSVNEFINYQYIEEKDDSFTFWLAKLVFKSILIIGGLITFYKRLKIGWYLVTIYFLGLAQLSIVSIFYSHFTQVIVIGLFSAIFLYKLFQLNNELKLKNEDKWLVVILGLIVNSLLFI